MNIIKKAVERLEHNHDQKKRSDMLTSHIAREFKGKSSWVDVSVSVSVCNAHFNKHTVEIATDFLREAISKSNERRAIESQRLVSALSMSEGALKEILVEGDTK